MQKLVIFVGKLPHFLFIVTPGNQDKHIEITQDFVLSFTPDILKSITF